MGLRATFQYHREACEVSPLERLKLGFASPLPLVLQTEASECGLACLSMVAQFHGLGASLINLRRTHAMSLKGSTLKDLVQIADHLGFATRPVRLELSEVIHLQFPCIVHWDLNHFVVLASASAKTVVIHDPAVGVRRMSLDEFSPHFTGVALELTPTKRFESATPIPRVRVWQLLGTIKGLPRSLSHLLTLALAIEILALISPFFLAWVVDHVLVAADRELLVTLVIGFGLLLLLQAAVAALRGWILIGLNASLRVQSRANLFTHLLNLPTSYFEARHLGDVMSRFSSQETILHAITTEMIEAGLDGLMAAITLIVMFIIAPDLALVVALGAVLYGLLRWTLYRPLRDATAEGIVWGAKRDTHFLETLRGVRTVKMYNAQEERRTGWLNLVVEAINRQLTIDKLRLLFATNRRLLLGLIGIIVIALGAHRVLSSAFSVGLLLAFIAFKDQFLERVSELINRASDLTMLKLHAERLADIALTEPETRGLVPTFAETTHLPASLEVRDVSFRYSPHEPWIIEKLSFQIAAGESVAIVGPSGSGKTTLLKLLSGLLVPEHGEILINGEPIRRIGLERYRSMLGVVMQDDQLFAGSVADNICFFSDRPNPQRIEYCAKFAAIHEDILVMPMGYGTLIGDMGTVLSGGQKQRVLIARALYRNPGVLFFDEATSHLDVERERAVNEALRRLHVTRVVIAHRPETIRAADRVIALNELNASATGSAGRQISLHA